MKKPLQPADWPFTKIVFTPPQDQQVDPATFKPVVCPVCVNNPDGVWSTLHSRWRPCNVCGGQGEIGGGA